VIPTRDFSEDKFLVFGTANGMVKKSLFKDYDTTIKAAGLIAINIRKGDELVQVRMSSGKDDIIMVSKSGHAVRFQEQKARPMGRGTAGVKGMNVSDKGNRVLSLDVVASKDRSGELLVVTENGYGKRTLVAEYPVKGRGTKGVLTIKLTAKKGQLAGALIVGEQNELVFISQNGMVQRTTAGEISQQGRATQGVRLMNLKAKDRVSAVALVQESANGNGNGTAASAPTATLADDAAATGNGAGDGAGDGAEAVEAAAAKPKPAAKPKAKAKAKARKPAKKPAAKKRAAPKAKAKAKAKPKPNPGTVRGSGRKKK
jgi:DNA gyrase subunit A